MNFPSFFLSAVVLLTGGSRAGAETVRKPTSWNASISPEGNCGLHTEKKCADMDACFSEIDKLPEGCSYLLLSTSTWEVPPNTQTLLKWPHPANDFDKRGPTLHFLLAKVTFSFLDGDGSCGIAQSTGNGKCREGVQQRIVDEYRPADPFIYTVKLDRWCKEQPVKRVIVDSTFTAIKAVLPDRLFAGDSKLRRDEWKDKIFPGDGCTDTDTPICAKDAHSTAACKATISRLPKSCSFEYRLRERWYTEDSYYGKVVSGYHPASYHYILESGLAFLRTEILFAYFENDKVHYLSNANVSKCGTEPSPKNSLSDAAKAQDSKPFKVIISDFEPSKPYIAFAQIGSAREDNLSCRLLPLWYLDVRSVFHRKVPKKISTDAITPTTTQPLTRSEASITSLPEATLPSTPDADAAGSRATVTNLSAKDASHAASGLLWGSWFTLFLAIAYLSVFEPLPQAA